MREVQTEMAGKEMNEEKGEMVNIDLATEITKEVRTEVTEDAKLKKVGNRTVKHWKQRKREGILSTRFLRALVLRSRRPDQTYRL